MSDSNEHAGDLAGVNGNGVQGDLLWGATAIGKPINRNARQVFHLYRIGAIKSIRRVGGKLVASRSALLRELGA